jgi:hypothetical protein
MDRPAVEIDELPDNDVAMKQTGINLLSRVTATTSR